MWVDYRSSLSTVYNDGEISTVVTVYTKHTHTHLLIHPAVEYPTIRRSVHISLSRGVILGKDGFELCYDVKQVYTTEFNYLHDVLVA